MNDEICDRLHIARRDLFEPTNIELESAFARGEALGHLERSLGVDDRHCANGMIGLLAAGAYIDWAATLGAIMQDHTLEDPSIYSSYSPSRKTAAKLAELKERFDFVVAPGSVRVYVIPHIESYLFDDHLSRELWIENLEPFRKAFQRWNSSRRRADLPHSTRIAIYAFAAGDLPAGLSLLAEAGKTYNEAFETPKEVVAWFES